MLQCDYCTEDAVGYDEDNALTCGCASCMPARRPLPAIIEITGDYGQEEEEEES